MRHFDIFQQFAIVDMEVVGGGGAEVTGDEGLGNDVFVLGGADYAFFEDC